MFLLSVLTFAPLHVNTVEKPRKAPAAAHKLAPRMPEGTVLTDLMKQQWKIGKPIGSGGFGLIYLSKFTMIC